MILDKLTELQKAGQPQTLDELFTSSKEGMLYQKVTDAVNKMLPSLQKRLMDEAKATISAEISAKVAQIKVQNGRDGKDGKSIDPQMVAQLVLPLIPAPKDGKDGKNAPTLEEILAKVPYQSGGGGGSTVIMDDLSSQANGSSTTFSTTKKIGTPLLVASTQFPQILRPLIDYSTSSTTLTLSSEVGAPQTGQTLVFIYIEG